MSPSYGTTTAVTTDYVLQLNPSSFFRRPVLCEFQIMVAGGKRDFLKQQQRKPEHPFKGAQRPQGGGKSRAQGTCCIVESVSVTDLCPSGSP